MNDDLLHIIAWNVEQAKDLDSFRLVSKAFAHTGIARLVRFLRIVVPSEKAAGTFTDIMAFLDAHPNARYYIERIHITGRAGRAWSFCNINTVQRLVFVAPNLLRLNLSYLQWTSALRFAHLNPTSCPAPFIYNKPRLESLSFMSIVSTASTPFEILNLVQSCDFFSIRSCAMEHFLPDLTPEIHPIDCPTLVICNNPFSSLFSGAFPLPLPFRNLTSLVLFNLDLPTLRALSHLLTAGAFNTVTDVMLSTPSLATGEWGTLYSEATI